MQKEYGGCVTSSSSFNDLAFEKLYLEFEKRYNPYPIQMAREEAFRKAREEGLIDEETYIKARNYYGKLWNYVGD